MGGVLWEGGLKGNKMRIFILSLDVAEKMWESIRGKDLFNRGIGYLLKRRKIPPSIDVIRVE